MSAEHPEADHTERETPVKDMIVRYGQRLVTRPGVEDNLELRRALVASDLVDLLDVVAPKTPTTNKEAMVRRALFGADGADPASENIGAILKMAPLVLMHENPEVDIMSEYGAEYFQAALMLGMQRSIVHQQCIEGERHCIKGAEHDPACPPKQVLAMATNIIDPVLEYTYLCEKDGDQEAIRRCHEVIRLWRRAMTKTWTGGMLAPGHITAILDPMTEKARGRVDAFVGSLDME